MEVTIKIARLVRSARKCYFTGTQPEIFQGRGGFAELGHLNKNFVKNTRKKAPQGKFWSLSPRYSLNYILDGIFNQKIDTIRAFFPQNQDTFFDFQKGVGEASPALPSLVARLLYRANIFHSQRILMRNMKPQNNNIDEVNEIYNKIAKQL